MIVSPSISKVFIHTAVIFPCFVFCLTSIFDLRHTCDLQSCGKVSQKIPALCCQVIITNTPPTASSFKRQTAVQLDTVHKKERKHSRYTHTQCSQLRQPLRHRSRLCALVVSHSIFQLTHTLSVVIALYRAASPSPLSHKLQTLLIYTAGMDYEDFHR